MNKCVDVEESIQTEESSFYSICQNLSEKYMRLDSNYNYRRKGVILQESKEDNTNTIFSYSDKGDMNNISGKNVVTSEICETEECRMPYFTDSQLNCLQYRNYKGHISLESAGVDGDPITPPHVITPYWDKEYITCEEEIQENARPNPFTTYIKRQSALNRSETFDVIENKVFAEPDKTHDSDSPENSTIGASKAFGAPSQYFESQDSYTYSEKSPECKLQQQTIVRKTTSKFIHLIKMEIDTESVTSPSTPSYAGKKRHKQKKRTRRKEVTYEKESPKGLEVVQEGLEEEEKKELPSPEIREVDILEIRKLLKLEEEDFIDQVTTLLKECIYWSLPPNMHKITWEPLHKHKKLLVLDLDLTLICKKSKYELGCLTSATQRFFYIIRPFVCEFIKEVSKLYEIIIYSSGGHSYVYDIVTSIPELNKHISYILDSQNCFRYRDIKIKTLQLLEGRKSRDIVIIDDIFSCWPQNIDNLIVVPPFYGDPTDNYFESMLIILQYLAGCKDVTYELAKLFGLRNRIKRTGKQLNIIKRPPVRRRSQTIIY